MKPSVQCVIDYCNHEIQECRAEADDPEDGRMRCWSSLIQRLTDENDVAGIWWEVDEGKQAFDILVSAMELKLDPEGVAAP